MTYQQDPTPPPRPIDGDPLDPAMPMNDPRADRPLKGMNVARGGSPLIGIFGAIAVIALLLLGVFALSDPNSVDPSRSAAQERTLPPSNGTAPDNPAVPK